MHPASLSRRVALRDTDRRPGVLRAGLAHVILYDFPDETACLACGGATRMRVAFSSGALFALCAACRRGAPA